MKRASLVEFGSLVIEEVDTPMPGPGQVRVAVNVCGICGTDIHAFQGLHPFISAPVVPGHEFSGVIDAIGPAVDGLSVGQKVTVEPSLVCGECEPCRTGRYNICDNLRVLGCQAPGAMAEMITVPAEKIVTLREDMSHEQGALIEPTAVAVHALRRADLGRVERMLVLGSGPIGLQSVQVGRAWGIPIIVATDIVDEKLAKASELGATHIVNVSQVTLADFFVEEYGKPNPMDLALECVGTEATLLQSIESVKKGGQIVVVGVPSADPRIRLSWVQDRELELLGALIYTRSDFEGARDLIAAGKVETEPLITARYPLERVSDAINELLRDPENNIKTLITIRA